MNRLAQGAEWLAQKQRSHAADLVFYSRSAAVTQMPAVRGRSTFDVTDSEGMLTRVESHDFVLLVSDMTLDDIPFTPEVGDRVTVGVQGEGEIYEVMAVPGQPPWRYTDEYREQIRVHTKHVESQLD